MGNFQPYVQLKHSLDLVFNPSKKCELTKLELKQRFVDSLLPGQSFSVEIDPQYPGAYLLLTDRYVFQARIWNRKLTREEEEERDDYESRHWSSFDDEDYGYAPWPTPELRCGFSINTCWDIRQNQTLEAATQSVYVQGGRYLAMITDNFRMCRNRTRGLQQILEALKALTEQRKQAPQTSQTAQAAPEKPQHPHFFDVQLAVTDAVKEFEGNQGISVTYQTAQLAEDKALFTLQPVDPVTAKALAEKPIMRLADAQGQDVFGQVILWDPANCRLGLQLWTAGQALPEAGQLHKCIAFGYNGIEDVLQSNQEGTAYDFMVGQLPEDLQKQCKEGLVLQFTKTDGQRQLATLEEYFPESGKLRLVLHGLDKNLIPVAGVLSKTLNPAYKYQQLAIKRISSNNTENPALYALLMGQTLPPITITEPYTPAPGVKMNESQRQAVEKAIHAQDLLLIQGPPGSGKTTIIVEMVRHFVKQGQRVLICSQSNHAVDNVLEKCLDLWYDPEKTKKVQCLRIGNSNKVEPALQGNLRRPLTQKIQDDMSRRSQEALQQHLQASQTHKNAFQAKQQQMLAMVDMILWAEELAAHLKKMNRKTMGFFSAMFALDASTKFSRFLRQARQQLEQLAEDLAALLQAREVSMEKHFSNIVTTVNELFEIVTRAKHERNVHPLRSYLYLKSDDIAILQILISQRQAWLGQQFAKLQSYTGNGDTVKLALKPNKWNQYGDQLHTVRRLIDDSIRAIDRKNAVMLESLEGWQKVLASDNKAIGEAMLKGVRIVGGTCIGTSTKAEFNEMTYDVVIVDEAGQIAMHDLLVPLVKARKMILIGDHVQLPPMENNDFAKYYMAKHYLADRAQILEDRKDDKHIPFFHPFSSVYEIFSKSLFEVLIRDPAYKDFTVQLDTQYRMHQSIADYISINFYGGKYKSIRPDSDFATGLQCFPGHIYFADTRNLSNKWEQKSADGKSYCNLQEARICATYIARILAEAEADDTIQKAISDKTGKPDIGVITAYGAQIARIRAALDAELAKRFSPDKAAYLSSCIAINTLDSFQGMENKVILYSFVRSNREVTEDKTIYTIGFMNDVRRLNVLMTRAKSLLIMIGDGETLTGTKARTKHDKTPAAGYYARLIDYCKKLDAYRDLGKEG